MSPSASDADELLTRGPAPDLTGVAATNVAGEFSARIGSCFHTYVVKEEVVVGHWTGGEIRRSCTVFQQKDEAVQRVVGVQRDKMGDVQEVSIPSRMVVVVVVLVVADNLQGLIRFVSSEQKENSANRGDFLPMSIYIPP